MAILNTSRVRLAGVAAAVPQKVEFNEEVKLDVENYSNSSFIAETGVVERRVAPHSMTTADYCVAAAEQLLSDLKWERSSIDAVIFVSQTPDYAYPATSCTMQERLGLGKECYALDISLGCSGWVYGLSVVSALLSSGSLKRALLLAGDVHVTTREAHSKKLPSYLLFGDAGTATAVEYSAESSGFNFHFGTDGRGAEAIIIPAGGSREPFDSSSLGAEDMIGEFSVPRTQIRMKGMDVFSFGISTPAKSIKTLSAQLQLNHQDCDYVVFHQANLKMLEVLQKKLKLRPEQTPFSISKFGNTSSASIPLTMVTELRDVLPYSQKKLLCSGFGVGLSWGTVVLESDHVVVSPLVEI